MHTEKEITYVIGHKNPDSDSICSAIALAELKSSWGSENVVAARAGDINQQTAFILDYFKAQPPRYLRDVYTKASDVMSTDVVVVSENAPLLKVMDIMRGQKIRFIPVLKADGRPRGVITLLDLTKRYAVKFEAEGSRDVSTSLKNIIEALGAGPALDFIGDRERVFSFYIGAMAEESFRKILKSKDPRQCAIIVGDREDIQKASVENGVGLLIVTGGFEAGAPVMEEAKRKKVSVIVSPHDTATTALLVRWSMPAYKVCESDFEKASPDDLVDDLRSRLAGAYGIVVLDEQGVMRGVITKSDILRPAGVNLILVDHNELSQAVDGAEKANILEVVDHHRIGSFNTAQPIPFICEPVGSTSTLVAEFYRKKGVEIRRQTAGLLLGGVLSDTVILRSPTTTGRDRDIVKWLEEKSGLDHRAFGSEIFAATSSLKKRGSEAAVRGDYKVFEAKGKKFGVGQVETIGFDEFREEMEGLMRELVKIKDEKGLRLSALLVTDIVMGTSVFLVAGEKEIAGRLDYPRLEDGVYELKNVISRKKQVVPHLISIFNEVYG